MQQDHFWVIGFNQHHISSSIHLKTKFSLLNKIADFVIELNIFVIYNLF